jgi:hypothetical protein
MFIYYVHCHFDFDYILFLAGEERESYVRPDFKLYIIFLPLQKCLQQKIFIFSYKSCKHNICIKKRYSFGIVNYAHTQTHTVVYGKEGKTTCLRRRQPLKSSRWTAGDHPPSPFLDCKLLLLFWLHVCSFFLFWPTPNIMRKKYVG